MSIGFPQKSRHRYLRTVYYRLYTRSGEDHSVHAFDPDEPSIGCIDRSTVAPPEDVAAIKRCIARAEGKPIYAFGDLYADVSDEPLANDACITDAPAGAVFHGSTPMGALRIVHPERRAGLFNRPLKILAAQPSVHPSMVATMVRCHFPFARPSAIDCIPLVLEPPEYNLARSICGRNCPH